MLVQEIKLYQAGRVEAAADRFDQNLPVNRHELRIGIGVRKEILRWRGAICTATARYPADSHIDQIELDDLLARLERVTGHAIDEIRTA